MSESTGDKSTCVDVADAGEAGVVVLQDTGKPKKPVKKYSTGKQVASTASKSRKKKSTADDLADATTVQYKVSDASLPDKLPSLSDDEKIILKLNVQPAEESQSQQVIAYCDEADKHAYMDLHALDSHSHALDSHSHASHSMGLDLWPSDVVNHVNHGSTFGGQQNYGIKAIKLLTDFEEKTKHGEWPASTSVHCYWCCHKFNTTPMGLPVKYAEGKFYVTGCFCSLECAAAYNFDSRDSIDDTLERYHLLNVLARELGYESTVKQAPNRLSLSMFGGHLSIEQFRGFCDTHKIVILNHPPMMTLTQQIEEINEYELKSELNRYIPIDSERVNRYKEKIKLKRTKPLTNFKNTLDHAMNLKFS